VHGAGLGSLFYFSLYSSPLGEGGRGERGGGGGGGGGGGLLSSYLLKFTSTRKGGKKKGKSIAGGQSQRRFFIVRGVSEYFVSPFTSIFSSQRLREKRRGVRMRRKKVSPDCIERCK